MKNTKTFENPWHAPRNPYSKPFYEVDEKPLATDGDVEFYTYRSNSVIAVRGETVLTECVTVAGAKRRLAQIS